MGTQQILLIVLSVIIVGVAVSVGITMFNQQAINAARQATIMDMNNFAAMTAAWYRTPTSQGGAGQSITDAGVAATSLRNYLGFTDDVEVRGVTVGAAGQAFENDNAGYSLIIDITGNDTVEFSSVIKETGIETDESPDLDIDLETGDITAHPTGRPAS